jgi:acetyl esterase/lipase
MWKTYTDSYSYIAAYLPSTTEADRRDPDISPFFADMYKMKAPPAIFTCGTLDPLLDDSVLMATKWKMSGAEAVLKLYPGMWTHGSALLDGVFDWWCSITGAPHGFVFFPIGGTPETQKALDDIKMFLDEHM